MGLCIPGYLSMRYFEAKDSQSIVMETKSVAGLWPPIEEKLGSGKFYSSCRKFGPGIERTFHEEIPYIVNAGTRPILLDTHSHQRQTTKNGRS